MNTLTIGNEIMIQIRRSLFSVLLRSTLLTAALVSTQTAFGQKLSPDRERELIAILRSNAEDNEKAMTCKKLAVDGSSEAVQELASLLKDEKLASWARIALESIPGKAAEEALVKASYSLQGKLLIGVINSIGVRRDAAAVDSLKVRLLDKDSDVASAAAVALGRIGNSNSALFLTELLSTAPANVRSAVAEGLVVCAAQFHSEGKNADAIKIYDNVRTADVAKQRIVEATRGAILARNLDGIPLLIEQLRAPDKAMFQIGLSTARELKGREVDQALVAELDKAAPERAALIIYAMADRSTVDMPAILKAAKAGQPTVRLAAINALAMVGNASCVPALLDISGEAESELSKAAKSTLAEMTDVGVNQAIAERLPKADGKMLATMIEIVGLRRIEATQELIKALSNPDKGVRGAAYMALGNTVPPSQLNVLIEQVVSPKRAEDLEAAILSLKTAAIRMPDQEDCASKLSGASNTAIASTKVALLEIIGAVGGKKALQTIEQAAKTDDAQLKDVSSKLLGEWMTIDAAPILLNLAKTGPADKYQVRALKGYIRIARQFVKNESEKAAMFSNAFDAARQSAEQKLVIDNLKAFPSIETLKVAVRIAQTPELKEEASQAAIAISEDKKFAGKPEEAKDILAKAGIVKAGIVKPK
jgi:HEAT repeat protein